MAQSADEHPEPGEQEPAAEFVERFAAGLVGGGMPRMPARVFAFLLSRDDGAATAAELAAALQASPAAISGAVRYLIQVRLITRSHRPGERRDVYRLIGDNWYEIVGHREGELRQWADLSRQGEVAIGPDTPAGRRLGDTARFFEFLLVEMAEMLRRWRSQQGD